MALVEGGVRTEENVQVLKELRERSKILIGLGTCAAFGGIPGLGSAHATLDLLMEAYTAKYSPEHTTHLVPREEPIDAYAEVEYYIPGCPPPLSILGSVLTHLFEGKEPPRVDLPLCAECQRIARREVQSEIKRTLNTVPEKEECLLSQGYICLGSVSRGGCEAPCTHAGVPCLGCRGPIDRVFTEPTHGILYDLVRRTSHFTGMAEKEVEAKLDNMVANDQAVDSHSQGVRFDARSAPIDADVDAGESHLYGKSLGNVTHLYMKSGDDIERLITTTNLVTLSDSATVNIDWEDAFTQEITLGGNRTLEFDNPVEGGKYVLFVIQDGTGSRTITWPSMNWMWGAEPTLTTDASAVDCFGFVYRNGAWYCVATAFDLG